MSVTDGWIAVADGLPPEGPQYLVFAPSDDNVRNPFIRISGFGPVSEPRGEPPVLTWQELPTAWRRAVTHWRWPLSPPIGASR